MRRLLALLALATALACGGGGGGKSTTTTPTPVAPTTYGIFRSLSASASPAPSSLVAGESAQANVALRTMTPREYHRSILMLNGKVLIVGGDIKYTDNGDGTYTYSNEDSTTPTMEIFDPETETFTISAAVPQIARYYGKATLPGYQAFSLVNLPDGKVAILGTDYTSGRMEHIAASYNYEVYDPETDTIAIHYLLSGGLYQIGDVSDAYYIGDGKIMLFRSTGVQAMLLDTATEMLSDLNARPHVEGLPDTWAVYNTSTLQDTNGAIWLVGGRYSEDNTDSKWVFRYANGSWERMPDLLVARRRPTLVALDGKIGVYGGTTGPNVLLKTVEIIDIDTGVITPSVDLVSAARSTSGVYLQTGYTFIAGGVGPSGGLLALEMVHNDTTGFTGSTGEMLHPRMNHCVTQLNNGLVLISGGTSDITVARTAEIFDPLAAIYVGYRSDTLPMGTTLQFTTTLEGGVTWSVNRPSIATISSTGILTPVSAGFVSVTATGITDSTKSATARIRVIPQ